MTSRVARAIVACSIAWCLTPRPAGAQETSADAIEPAFSLSSSQIFTTRDSAAFDLTFQHLTQLDFRVYRVRDPFAFFAALKDPHQLGAEERPVELERSLIERLADWKTGQRRRIRAFFRNQVSYEYRTERRKSQDRQEIAQRVVLNKASFAQVPLLNPEQLVTAWRELLPDRRDAEMRRVPLDVSGPGVYAVEAVSGLLRAYTIVIVSDLGIVTKVAPGQVLTFVANRQTGEPQAGCDVQILADQRNVGTGRTDADGVVELAIPEAKSESLIGVARCDQDVAATDPGAWYAQNAARELLAYVYTDKPIYRPGHTVHVKAVLRWRERDSVRMFDGKSVELTAADENEKVVTRQTLSVDEFGAVHARFVIPPSAALGTYRLRIATGEHQAFGALEVQEYRRPEFEVIVTPEKRFVQQGGEAVATIQARYYFGQPVANGRVHYVVNQQGYYSPLRWDEDAEESNAYFYGGDQTAEGDLQLDAQGRGEIRVALDVSDQRRDFSARIEARVTDASSREVSGNTTVHATYGPFLVTARVNQYVFAPGQPVDASVRTIDYAGAAQPNVAMAVRLDRITYPDGYYNDPKATAVGEAKVTTDAEGRALVSLTLPKETGTYRITATATVDDREISDETWLWVPGPSETTAADEDRYLELLTDKRSYAPGESAKLMVRGETLSGPVLVTKEGQHVTWHRVIRAVPTSAVEVPVDEGDIGDIYVAVAYMREGRLYRADRRIAVPAQRRTLQVTVSAERAVAKPQDPGIFTVNVTDHAGKPVRAQVSLGVIDEAVYAIRPDDTPDPVRFFYRREYSRVGTAFSRDYYFTGFAGNQRLQLAGRRRRPFTLADFKGDKPVQPQVRKEFPDAIFWVGDLVTDDTGQARVTVKYPDSLTTWRLTARAVTTDTHAGASVLRTTTTKDLIVRVITPRFLTEGDQVVLPTIVHNYRDTAKDAAISFEARGLQAAAATAPAPAAGTLAAGGERRDDWRFTASTVGTAAVTATARTDEDSDAVELPIPVLPYGLRREVGSSGSLVAAADHSVSVDIPAASNPAARVVRVSLAPSLAGSLLGALDYLTSFPYGCTEQILSGFVPNLLVTRALARLKLAPTEGLSQLDRQVGDGLRRLYDMQHDDGGWGWWKTDPNHPFMTAYAVFGLLQAKEAGYRVRGDVLERGLAALAAQYAEYPRATPDLKAYLAFVLQRAGGTEPISFRPARARPESAEVSAHNQQAAIDELWAARDRMSPYGRALLLSTLDAAKDGRGNDLASTLLNEVQTKGDLSWWQLDSDPLLFDSIDTSVEATALALQALAPRDPEHAVLDRAVRWLMANRAGGYWSTTKQTAMALYGLLAVLEARNEIARPFSVDVYINGTLARTQSFTAASLTDPDPIVITAAGREGANTVRLVKKGEGSLYWSATAVFHDTQGAASRSGSRQLAITRKYSRLAPVRNRQGNIVYREEAFDGRMNPGDVLTVRLTVAGSNDWRYLILEDPLPAGVEAIQDTTAYPLERPSRRFWWWGSQVEYRDTRTVFFQESFSEGRYEFVYLVKAISSGEFRAVPAQIAPMYVPGVSASSEPQTVIVTVPEGSR